MLGLTYPLMIPRYNIGQDVQQVMLAPSALALVILALKSKKAIGFFMHPALQTLGRLSFPMYLLHWPLLLALFPLIKVNVVGVRSESPLLFSICALIYCLITLIASCLYEKFVDAAAINLGRRLRCAINI